MRRGVTLVEMLLVLALLGVITGVVAVRLRPPASFPLHSWVIDSVASVRRRAIASGNAQTIVLELDTIGARQLTAFPDGRVVSDDALGVDLLTGIVR